MTNASFLERLRAQRSMRIDVLEEPLDLVEYARIPIAFEVTRVLDVTGNAAEGFALAERCLGSAPYVKNYDAIPGERPDQWPQRFDLANWGFLACGTNTA